jgi:CHAD domain-containing protein
VFRVSLSLGPLVGESELLLPSSSQSTGVFAAALLEQRVKRLVGLQLDVLADRDPEPLHQMRVTCRQMRSTVEQFADALVLPEAVSPQRLARIGSDLGLSRDLDVLRHRLEHHWQPLLPEREQAALRKLLKQLKRERKLAFTVLTDTLKGRRYLKLLERLQGWLRKPRFTPMGEEAMEAWCPELQQVALAGLFTLPGWWVMNPREQPSAQALHQLRRRIKRARYGLHNLAPLEPQRFQPWVDQFKTLQTVLGDLQDLKVLVLTLERLLEAPPDSVMPCLCSLVLEAQDQAWQSWRERSAPMCSAEGRQALLKLQLQA